MSSCWAGFDLSPRITATTNVTLVPLLSESVLSVTGADSQKFLQGQTTTDFREVTANTSRLGCLCNLKGRAVLSFRALQWGEHIHLLVDQSLLTTARTTLQKYIIFSKAQLSTPDMAIVGVCGADSAAWLQQQFDLCPSENDAVVSNEQVAIVRLSAQRYLLLLTSAALAHYWPTVTTDVSLADLNTWRLAQIADGEAQVFANSSEQFQPQELNFPQLNGVSYNKGCYTGQEIVARLYFRGKLKNWTHRFVAKITTLPAINSAIVNPDGQTVGHVVLAATQGDAVELLAIARYDQVQDLRLADNTPLTVLPLPYVVEARE